MNQLGQNSNNNFNGDITVIGNITADGNVTADDGNFDNINVIGTTKTGILKVNTNPLNDYTLPTSRGLVNQILQTDANGIVSWVNDISPPGNTVNVIYKQGGTSAGNVYATWLEIISIIDQFKGTVTVFIDNSITNPSVITDSFNGYGAVVISPYLQNAGSQYCQLDIGIGVTITNLKGFDGAMLISPQSVGGPSFIFDTSAIFSILDGAVISTGASATTAAIEIPDNSGMILACGLGSGINNYNTPLLPFINVGVSSQLIMANILNTNSNAWSNDIISSVDNSSQLITLKDASAIPITNSLFTGSLVDLLIDAALNVSYNNSLLPSVGTTVQAAIDFIKQNYYTIHGNPIFESLIVKNLTAGDTYSAIDRDDEAFNAYLQFRNIGVNVWSIGEQTGNVVADTYSLRIINHLTGDTEAFKIHESTNVITMKDLVLNTINVGNYINLTEHLEFASLGTVAAPPTNSARVYYDSGSQALFFRPEPNQWTISGNPAAFAMNTKVYTDYYFSNNAVTTDFSGTAFQDVECTGMLQLQNNNVDYGTWSTLSSQVRWDLSNTRNIVARVSVNFNYVGGVVPQILRFGIFINSTLQQQSTVTVTANTTRQFASVQCIVPLNVNDLIKIRVENNDGLLTSITVRDLNYNIVEI